MSPRLSRRGALSTRPARTNWFPYLYTWGFETNLKDDQSDTYEFTTLSGTTPLTRSTTYSYAGTYSLRMQNNAGFSATVSAVVTTLPKPTVQPSAVTISGWFYVPTGDPRSPSTATLRFSNKTPALEATSTVQAAWTQLTVSLSAAQISSWFSSGNMDITMIYDRVRDTGSCYWDEIKIEMTA